MPEEIHAVELRGDLRPSGKLEIKVQRDITNLLVEAGLVKSRSEANRLLAQGAIEVDGEKVNSNLVTLKDGSVIKVGKRRFLRMVDSAKKKWQATS
jgi:tyrosyl-tRNA synthetase